MKIQLLLLGLWLSGCATTPGTQNFMQGGRRSTPPPSFVHIDHGYFQVGYDEELRLPRYVVYQLKAENLKIKRAMRRNKFKPDPYLVEHGHRHVLPTEYAGSPYHRGHMAPHADFAWSQEASDLTFVMSNMAPQLPNLNSNAWLGLEKQVRLWGCGEGIVTVITGPVLGGDMVELGSGLKVPPAFFKIIIDETPPIKAIAFIYNQGDRGDVLHQRQVSIAKVLGYLKSPQIAEVVAQLKALARMPASIEDWNEENCLPR